MMVRNISSSISKKFITVSSIALVAATFAVSTQAWGAGDDETVLGAKTSVRTLAALFQDTSAAPASAAPAYRAQELDRVRALGRVSNVLDDVKMRPELAGKRLDELSDAEMQEIETFAFPQLFAKAAKKVSQEAERIDSFAFNRLVRLLKAEFRNDEEEMPADMPADMLERMPSLYAGLMIQAEEEVPVEMRFFRDRTSSDEAVKSNLEVVGISMLSSVFSIIDRMEEPDCADSETVGQRLEHARSLIENGCVTFKATLFTDIEKVFQDELDSKAAAERARIEEAAALEAAKVHALECLPNLEGEVLEARATAETQASELAALRARLAVAEAAQAAAAESAENARAETAHRAKFAGTLRIISNSGNTSETSPEDSGSARTSDDEGAAAAATEVRPPAPGLFSVWTPVGESAPKEEKKSGWGIWW